MTKTEVIELMKSASSEEDWNNKCDQVKSACGGYPDYWFAEIIASGLANEIKAGFFMFTKQDLYADLLKPIPYKPVTICGRVCDSPEDIIRLGYELVATDPEKFKEYQQLMDDGFKKSLGS
jgi:hypothetical protein